MEIYLIWAKTGNLIRGHLVKADSKEEAMRMVAGYNGKRAKLRSAGTYVFPKDGVIFTWIAPENWLGFEEE